MTFTSFHGSDFYGPLVPPNLRDLVDLLPPDSAAVATDEPSQYDPPSRPAFDGEATLARVEGNRELLRQMVGVFAMQWHTLRAEIAKAGQRHDGPTLEL